MRPSFVLRRWLKAPRTTIRCERRRTDDEPYLIDSGIIGSRAAPYNPASLPSRARVMIVLRPFPGSTSAEAPWLAARGSGGAVAAYTIERHRSSSKIVGEKASHALEAPPPIT